MVILAVDQDIAELVMQVVDEFLTVEKFRLAEIYVQGRAVGLVLQHIAKVTEKTADAAEELAFVFPPTIGNDVIAIDDNAQRVITRQAQYIFGCDEDGSLATTAQVDGFNLRELRGQHNRAAAGRTQRIESGTTVDAGILRIVNQGVVTAATEQDVCTGTAVQRIVATAADQAIDTGTRNQRVVPAAAVEQIIAGVAVQGVVVGAAKQAVITAEPVQAIVTAQTIKRIGPAGTAYKFSQ